MRLKSGEISWKVERMKNSFRNVLTFVWRRYLRYCSRLLKMTIARKKFSFVEMPAILKTYYRKYEFKNRYFFFTMSADGKFDKKSPQSAQVKLAFKELNKIIGNLKKMQQKCVICLNNIEHRCFLDNCLHSFCMACVSEWSKEKKLCPTCGQGFVAVFYNVRSIRSYKIRKFADDRRQSCLLKSMKNINSFYEINENVKRIFKTYKLSFDTFCNAVVCMKWAFYSMNLSFLWILS